MIESERLAASGEGESERVCVLVAYASRYGSTRGIAERIAARLASQGRRVDLREVDGVDDVGAYHAIVLGSGVFNQCWVPEAAALVRDNVELLADRPVWLFSVASFGDTKRFSGSSMKREPREMDGWRAAIHPRDYRVFAGVIERERWPWFGRAFSGPWAGASGTTVTGRR